MTKKLLQDYLWLRRSVDKLEEQINTYRDAIDIKSPNLQTDGGRSTAETDKLAATIADIVDKQNDLNARWIMLQSMAAEIEKLLTPLPYREQYILKLKYIDGKSLEQICVELNYSYRQIKRYHARAFKLLEKMAHNVPL